MNKICKVKGYLFFNTWILFNSSGYISHLNWHTLLIVHVIWRFIVTFFLFKAHYISSFGYCWYSISRHVFVLLSFDSASYLVIMSFLQPRFLQRPIVSILYHISVRCILPRRNHTHFCCVWIITSHGRLYSDIWDREHRPCFKPIQSRSVYYLLLIELA
jgi:hypothetical protein